MAQKQKCPEFENHERWLVPYADMLTLLFAVFVVLFALKKEGADAAKVQQAAVSIQESFSDSMEDIPESRRNAPSEAGFGIFEHRKGDRMRAPVVPKHQDASRAIKVIDAEMKKTSEAINIRLYGQQKFREMEKTGKGLERIVSVQRDLDGFRVRLLASHFYKPGQYTLSQSALRDVQEIGKILKELGRPITIEGHTDAVPAGGDKDNWVISSLRATNLLKYFIDAMNFAPTSISAAGYAETRPIASNATEETRALNRRIEIKVHYND